MGELTMLMTFAGGLAAALVLGYLAPALREATAGPSYFFGD